MKEEQFYQLLDIWEESPGNITDGYYPTVEELKKCDIENKIEKYANIISYFASDPYKNTDVDRDDEEYQRTVKCCTKLLYKIKLT